MIPPTSSTSLAPITIPPRTYSDRAFTFKAGADIDFERSQIVGRAWLATQTPEAPYGLAARMAIAFAFGCLWVALSLLGGCATGPDVDRDPPSVSTPRHLNCTPIVETDSPELRVARCSALTYGPVLGVHINAANCGVFQPREGDDTLWSYCEPGFVVTSISDGHKVMLDGDVVAIADTSECVEEFGNLCVDY